GSGGGSGDQGESVGLGGAVEQPGALARNVGEQAHLELVDQVEPHERPPEADAAPDHDVTVAASPELVDLFCRVTSGDGGVGPVGRRQGPGEDDLARGVQDVGERVVGGRCHGPGDALVGGTAHDVRVRATEKLELRRFFRRLGCQEVIVPVSCVPPEFDVRGVTELRRMRSVARRSWVIDPTARFVLYRSYARLQCRRLRTAAGTWLGTRSANSVGRYGY